MMQYIFKKSYRLAFPAGSEPSLLLAEPEAEARALYARHLAGLSSQLVLCGDLEEVALLVRESKPDLVIISASGDFGRLVRCLERAKASHPPVSIITLGHGIPVEALDQLMGLGVSVHINRGITRPQDVAGAAQAILSGLMTAH
jgi:hypothetical protein